jgi:hypothetical protein
LKKSTAASHNIELSDNLHDFQKKQTVIKFGHLALKNNGLGMFMSKAILQSIVDCTQYGKIQTIEDLAKETRWPHSSEYGGDVLAMIQSCTPLAPTTTDHCNLLLHRNEITFRNHEQYSLKNHTMVIKASWQ